MAEVYILYSIKGKCYYTGSCKNLETRLEEHLSSRYLNSFTSKYNDWEIYFSINNLEYKQAREIELHIKKMKSKKYIENLKRYPAMQTKLMEKYRMK